MTLLPENYAHAERAFLKHRQEIQTRTPRYEPYFEWLRPRSDQEVFQRGLFAYASVHTTWESNVRLYTLIKGYNSWLYDDVALKKAIVESRAGLFNNRTRYIGRFGRLFWSNPGFFQRAKGERWTCFRNRIMRSMAGLGPAKSAFFLELTSFGDNEVACVDTHMLQMYGVKPKDVGDADIDAFNGIEMHWRNMCLDCGIKPVVARWVLWDVKQGHADSRYWSYVLEG